MPKLTRSILLLCPLWWAACFSDEDTPSSGDSGTTSGSASSPLDSSATAGPTTSAGSTTGGGTAGGENTESGGTDETYTSGAVPCLTNDDCGEDFCIEGLCSVDPPPNMELVGAGPFPMGCHDPDCDPDETPVHDIHLDRFAIDRLEVTVSAYQSCIDAGECSEPSTADPQCNWGRAGYGGHPINCVTWTQADAYCHWTRKRLPTEAEWEKASRGTDGRRFSWGDEPADCTRTVMLIGGWGCGTGNTWPVGSKPLGASPYGLMDMTGNVREWVQDWYADDYFSNSPGQSPEGPPSGTERVTRGGSFFGGKQVGLRSGNRESAAPEATSIAWGFRCADG